MRDLLLWLLMTTAAGAQGMIGGGVSTLPQAPPRDPGARPVMSAGTGIIRGRVTAADTGAPMRGAQVSLGGQQRRAVYTDHEGRYQFDNLPRGTYTIVVSPGNHRARYQTLPYGTSGSTRAFMVRPRPIELGDGQRIDNVDVALPRTGVISGRVTDADGEPAARVQVGAWMLRAGAEPVQNGSAQTDDLGQFRIFGIVPGDYFLRASPRVGGLQVEVEGEVRGFAPTYAPGTPLRADAMRLRVTRGAEVSADIRLTETRVYSISGTVVTSKGDAPGNLTVMLTPAGDHREFSFGVPVSPGGTFTMRNVPPGQYEVVARYMPPRVPGAVVQGPDPAQEYASVRVDLGMGHIEGIVLATAPGAAVTGEIVFDEPAEGRRPSLFAQPSERLGMVGSPLVDVKDMAFTLRNLFGPVLIRGVAGGGPTWGLKAVLLRGQDITDVPTTFTASDSGHLQVVFTARAPSMEGTVTDEAGKPLEEASIILFGHDPSTWQPRSSYFRASRIVKEGKYMFSGLREGRYFAVAVPMEVGMEMTEPNAEMLEVLSKVATAVTLNAGEKRTVDLTLVRFQEQ